MSRLWRFIAVGQRPIEAQTFLPCEKVQVVIIQLGAHFLRDTLRLAPPCFVSSIASHTPAHPQGG